jgi:hypothetical protein
MPIGIDVEEISKAELLTALVSLSTHAKVPASFSSPECFPKFLTFPTFSTPSDLPPPVCPLLAPSNFPSQEYANCILVQFKVAQQLCIPFNDLIEKDPYEVLQILLMQGHERCELLKEFIKFCRMDTTLVSRVLADHCIKSLLGTSPPQRPLLSPFSLFHSTLPLPSLITPFSPCASS